MPEQAQFCSSCGKPVLGTDEPPRPARRLVRPMSERKIAGVCAGFSRYLGVDVTVVRIVWLVVALIFGTGFIAYLVAWIAMPKDYDVPETAPAGEGI
jgi:phage shock protein C